MDGTSSSHHSSNNTVARAVRDAAAAAAMGPSGARHVLNKPVDLSADPAVAHAELEKARRHLAEQAKVIGTEKRRF